VVDTRTSSLASCGVVSGAVVSLPQEAKAPAAISLRAARASRPGRDGMALSWGCEGTYRAEPPAQLRVSGEMKQARHLCRACAL
jgi:hypothetical protein